MGALDRWLTNTDPWGDTPAKFAKSAKAGQIPQKPAAHSLATPLLSPANLASLSKPPAKLHSAENRGKQGALADLADLAAPAIPLGKVAAKSPPPPRNLVVEDWFSFFTERSAILEHAAGLTREKADRLAYES